MKLTTNTAEGRSYLYHSITGETIAECKKERHAQTIAHRVNRFEELRDALEFTQKKLFSMTTEEFSNGGDTTIRATIAIALERAKQ